MIERFEGKYEFLSNFSHSPIVLDGKVYRTVEHAFQAFKATSDEEHERIRKVRAAGQAKRLGRRCRLRSDWEDVRLSVMRRCLLAKFTQHAELAERLVATGAGALVEGNTWGDRFWGEVDGEGENWLGRLLEEVRDAI